MQMDKADIEMLERFIDAYGISEVLSGLSFICGEKAEHVSVNWQDTKLGKRWMRRAKKLDTLSKDFDNP